MALELKDIIMVRHMSASLRKIDQMAKENIFGRMEAIIKGNSSIIFVTARVIISLILEIKSMKVNFEMIKNPD